MNARLVASLLVSAVLPATVSAQLARQSQLTAKDADPKFQLTLEHLALDVRWLGLPPRDVAWSPDGERVYFRWREDPKADQNPETDPWYAVDRAATKLTVVPADEVKRIPSSNLTWSANRRLAAWSRAGTLFVWTRDKGVRPVYTALSELGDLHVASDGSGAFFATKGFQNQSEESADLWFYDVAAGHVRQVAAVNEKKEDKAEKEKEAKWLKEQQLELVEIVRKRKEDKENADAARRDREPFRPQVVLIEKGARAYNFRLSPDGRFLTFLWTKKPSADQRTRFMEFVNESGYATEKTARPKVGESLAEYRMGIVRVDPLRDPEKVEIVWVDDGIEKKTIVHGPFWSPTGSHGVVQVLSMDHKDRWIAMLDPASAKVSVVHHEHQDDWIGGPLVVGRWSPGYLQWLPDGSAFAFASEATGWAMLYLAEPGGKVTPLTEGEWEVRDAQLSPDGKSWHLATSREHPGEEHFYQIPVRGGPLTRITLGEGKHRSYLSPDGARVATLYENPREMADLYLQEARPGAAKLRVTQSGTDDFYRYAWNESSIFSFPDPTGKPAWAKLWSRPAKPNGAAVIHVHGCGECAQGVDKASARSPATVYANFLHQKGYVTATLDYRGSLGYGHQNRTYAYRQMGISDVDSVLPFLDILAERHGVDRGRIGIYGGSYGGFFTLMSLFRHPGKYRAGVALYPVTDWAHYNQGYTSRILNGTPAEDPEAYRRSSPVFYAKGLEDALQIQHGLVDDNVQVQDSFRLSQILMEQKKEFDLVVYPMEDHGWDENPTRRDSYWRMTEWFDRNLVGPVKERITTSSRQ
jgi:dipeptidyl aminopeptidase/acylaminoacyl peptidase